MYENSLNKMRVFELELHKTKMSDYMKGRDFLISELYDEVWVQQQINDQKDLVIEDQSLMINELQNYNYELKQKNKRKTKTIIILIVVDVIFFLGLVAFN